MKYVKFNIFTFLKVLYLFSFETLLSNCYDSRLVVIVIFRLCYSILFIPNICKMLVLFQSNAHLSFFCKDLLGKCASLFCLKANLSRRGWEEWAWSLTVHWQRADHRELWETAWSMADQVQERTLSDVSGAHQVVL